MIDENAVEVLYPGKLVQKPTFTDTQERRFETRNVRFSIASYRHTAWMNADIGILVSVFKPHSGTSSKYVYFERYGEGYINFFNLYRAILILEALDGLYRRRDVGVARFLVDDKNPWRALLSNNLERRIEPEVFEHIMNALIPNYLYDVAIKWVTTRIAPTSLYEDYMKYSSKTIDKELKAGRLLWKDEMGEFGLDETNYKYIPIAQSY